MRVKTSKQPPPAPTTSAVGPCPTVIQIVGRPGTGSLPSTIALFVILGEHFSMCQLLGDNHLLIEMLFIYSAWVLQFIIIMQMHAFVKTYHKKQGFEFLISGLYQADACSTAYTVKKSVDFTVKYLASGCQFFYRYYYGRLPVEHV